MHRTLRVKEIENDGQIMRLQIVIHGAVQGVGFRPFIYRLATKLGLRGWVSNSSQGVFVEVEGSKKTLENFLLLIKQEKPPRSFIQSIEYSFLDAKGYSTFNIRPSDDASTKSALILPDIATCTDCMQEIFDPHNRRYLYPFTNCTNCGPRLSIIEELPYDRSNTTMKNFIMCNECQAEYENPLDRRFHAQPNACPKCGPHIELWDSMGKILDSHHEAILRAVDAIRRGAIVALKSLGGFHLIVDARSEEEVLRLRRLKNREEKPFALMYPSLELVKAHCEVSELEEQLLNSPESPIVLLRRRLNVRSSVEISNAVTPDNPYLGIVLPYTPLHYILMAELNFPVVATSGNISDEPMCIDENEALKRLGGIADLFLVHDRPIARHVDDSVVRVLMGRMLMLRSGRGYAPLSFQLKETIPPLLSVGANLKNTIAISVGRDVFLSQHIGDIETVNAFEAFQEAIVSFSKLYDFKPQTLTCDAHPAYLSTQFAEKQELPLIRVQHHYAHALSCMAENELSGPLLGVSWDGTGYGLDGTIWGGEFLRITEKSFERVAHFRVFSLPGGEKAIREPRRIALGLLYEIFGDSVFEMRELSSLIAFSSKECRILETMLKRKINTPLTSSVGRLFDAVSSIVGLCQYSGFEGQAAMRLEFALEGTQTNERFDFEIIKETENDFSSIIIDWAPMIKELLDDLQSKKPIETISAKFHNTLVETIIAIAHCVDEKHVVLTGGCFQNRHLIERTVHRLRSEGFYPYWHHRIPPNDGCIALGQIIAASRMLKKE